MKKIFQFASVAALSLATLTGCLKEINPQTDYVTIDQAGDAPGSFDNFVAAITNTMAGQFVYSAANQYPYDYG